VQSNNLLLFIVESKGLLDRKQGTKRTYSIITQHSKLNLNPLLSILVDPEDAQRQCLHIRSKISMILYVDLFATLL
jgi:hypothetical protein